MARFTFSRQTRRAAALLFLSSSAFATLAPACSNSNTASGLAAEQTCSLNSDCARGLICALGKCRAECVTAADCGSGGTCVDNGSVAVCQSAADYNTPCSKPSDCSPPLACASDYRCRNLCATNADCNVLGIMGRVCAKDANGVDYCADPPAETNGVITAAPPPGASDAGVVEPALDASSGGDGAMAGDGAMTSDGPSAMDSTISTDSGMSKDGGGPRDGGGGTEGGATCNPGCAVGSQCVGGTCMPCGTMGEVCCGTACGTNLTCSGGMCTCGGAGEECCGGTMCNNGVTCVSGVCACGSKAGEACCPTAMVDAEGTCTAPLQCAGIGCSCLLAISGTVVQRSDGTLWNARGTPVAFNALNGTAFVATSFSSGGSNTCAVASDSTVWCWGSNEYGALGNGTTTTPPASVPVQVLTAASGPALMNIVKVFVDTSFGWSACAIDATAKVWCWGYNASGELGNGLTTASSVPVPVLTQAGGAQFGGADQVAIVWDHTCARKTDGTLWCWGSNAIGQLGVGTTTASYLYPTQVTALFSNVVSVTAASSMSAVSSDTCAVTTDGTAWCWGGNIYGQLGNGLKTGEAIVPGQVLSSMGGAAFAGVADILLTSESTCLLKSADRSLWCWGTTASGLVPAQVTQMAAPVTHVFALGQDTDYPFYIGGDGNTYSGGSQNTATVTSAAVMCP